LSNRFPSTLAASPMQRKRRLGVGAALPEAGPPTRFDLEFHLLRDAQCVVDLDTKVTDGAFEPCVPERVGFVLRISFLIENQRPVAHRSVLAVAMGCAGR
jgi:hypothetical protein